MSWKEIKSDLGVSVVWECCKFHLDRTLVRSTSRYDKSRWVVHVTAYEIPQPIARREFHLNEIYEPTLAVFVHNEFLIKRYFCQLSAHLLEAAFKSFVRDWRSCMIRFTAVNTTASCSRKASAKLRSFMCEYERRNKRPRRNLNEFGLRMVFCCLWLSGVFRLPQHRHKAKLVAWYFVVYVYSNNSSRKAHKKVFYALHRKNSFSFGQFLFAGLIEKMLVTIAGHFDLIRSLNLNQI